MEVGNRRFLHDGDTGFLRVADDTVESVRGSDLPNNLSRLV